MARPAQVARRLGALALSLATKVFDLLCSLARHSLGLPMPPRGVVLYYHAVKPHQRAMFARQMDEILRRGRAFSLGSNEALSGSVRHVAVSFDDGYQSVVEHAVPALTARAIPFTIFAPSGCLGQRPSWVRSTAHPYWEECVLSAEQLRTLAASPLATIGSHSVTHQNLPTIAAAEAMEEFASSKENLQAVTGLPVDLFSFPHGGYTAALLGLARQAGYRRVFTIEPTPVPVHSAAFVIGRVAVDPEDWPLEFRLKIEGAYRWRLYLRRLRKAG